MLKSPFFVLLAYAQLTSCSESPFFSERSSTVLTLEKIEAGALLMVGEISVHSGSHPASPFFSAWITAPFFAHLEWIKALIHNASHATELQSFYKEKPAHAFYEVMVTITSKSSETIKPFDLSETKTFHHQEPLELIKEANTFITKWTEENEQRVKTIIITLAPSVTTQRGKTITLSPLSFAWNKRDGIDQDLRKKFFLTGSTHTQKTYTALGLSTLACAVFIIPRILWLHSKARSC
jgi:hypothetical protein